MAKGKRRGLVKVNLSGASIQELDEPVPGLDVEPVGRAKLTQPTANRRLGAAEAAGQDADVVAATVTDEVEQPLRLGEIA